MTIIELLVPLKVLENNVKFKDKYGITFINYIPLLKLFVLTTDKVEIDKDSVKFIYSLKSWDIYA